MIFGRNTAACRPLSMSSNAPACSLERATNLHTSRSIAMPLQPLTDKTRFPDDDALRASLGEPYYAYWSALDNWLRGVYAVEPLVQYGGAKSGWTFRYRKGGRPLCEMTPAAGGFSTLV